MGALLMQYRLYRGLYWEANKPKIVMPWRQILVIVACMLAYSVAHKYDRLEHRAKKMEALAESNAGLAEVTLNCMSASENKEIGGFYFKDVGLSYSCEMVRL